MIFENIIGPARPVSWLFRFWPVLLTSFVGSLGATWLCKKTAVKFGIVDKPDDLVKTHKEPIAYLGGIGMFIGLMAGILAGITVLRNDVFLNPILKLLLGIGGGGAVACVVGVADDILDIKPWQKLTGQTIAAVFLILVGIVPALHLVTRFFFKFDMPYLPELILGIPIVIIFVLGASNSLNLLDGLDGLCGGVTAIITVAMLILAIHLATWGASDTTDPVRIIVCLGLVGGVCGFLPFNRHPAKIFMGDAGSMLLGFTVAALMILFWQDVPRWCFAAIVAFGLPILDTATALIRRFINKRPLFVSDRGHIYDQMIDRGLSLKKTVIICYLLSAFYAVFGVGMGITTAIRTIHAIFIYAALFLVSGFVIWKRGYLKMEGLRGATNTKV